MARGEEAPAQAASRPKHSGSTSAPSIGHCAQGGLYAIESLDGLASASETAADKERTVASGKRERELRMCGRYFLAMEAAREPTDEERFERNAALWCNALQGVALTPAEAVRLPRLVMQPKPWVRELLGEVGNSGA